MRRILILMVAGALLGVFARAQDDAPSLGDVARQARAQKQKDGQAKEASAKDTSAKDAKAGSNAHAQSTASSSKDVPQAKTAHVITEEELPAHVATVKTADHHSDSTESDAPPTGDREAQAEQWKSQIRAQKNAIASLQREIAELGNSIHYVGGNCVTNCAQWNERQQQKQQQVDSMKAELEEQQRHLEEMQESARKQGFGSSVYEP